MRALELGDNGRRQLRVHTSNNAPELAAGRAVQPERQELLEDEHAQKGHTATSLDPTALPLLVPVEHWLAPAIG